MMIVLRLQVEYDYVPAVPLPPDDVGDAAVVLGPVQRRPVAESLTLVPGHQQHWQNVCISSNTTLLPEIKISF